MASEATLQLDGKDFKLPIIVGSEGEKALDCRNLRRDTGYITYDEGLGNTGSCESQITFIEGDQGILRYRGYPIEQLAEHSDFVETTHLVMHGELPTPAQRQRFSTNLRENSDLHRGLYQLLEHFPPDSHPMAVLSASMNALGCYYPHLATNNHERDLKNFEEASAIAISKVRTLAAMSYRLSRGLALVHPKRNLTYCENFLHMMFSEPYHDYVPEPEVVRALNLILLLHADHEQNCSTSTVRMVASSGANLFASVSAGICALWGPLHGGANQAVLEMLEEIHADGDDGTRFIQSAKSGKARLMGFGHRVYKNYDPRAKIIGKACDEVLAKLGRKDPLLDIARNLEQAALKDPYFVDRKLYPNVDFYSGIILRAIGIPLNMFTVMFAIGRMPGWIANWKEVASTAKSRIYRPRQVYIGNQKRDYVAPKDRG